MRQRRTLAGMLIFFLLAGGIPSAAWGEAVDEETLMSQIREVSKHLRCTVCQSESVWESNSLLARQMREIIRERLIQGQTPEEIKDYFFSRYGDYILLEPRKSGMNWLLWVGPFVLLAVGGAVLYRRLRQWAAQTSAAEPEGAPEPISDRNRRRIEEERHSLEGEKDL